MWKPRTTKAAEFKLYNTINYIYGPDITPVVATALPADDNATYTTGGPLDATTEAILNTLSNRDNDTIPDLLEVFVNTSHNKDDFIVRWVLCVKLTK
jgi:hypothetical protein